MTIVFNEIFYEVIMNEHFSSQTVSALIGAEKAFINKACEVDSGKITAATVDETGAVTKVVIQGSKKATVGMEQVFETVEVALEAAILITKKHIHELNLNVAAMEGRVKNIQEKG